jgi:hypothetical protein
LLGLLLAASSGVTFVPRMQNQNFALKNARWLPWLAFPIGVESGFSSAGAGALGTVLLLNYSEMTPPQVVGTDLVFGLVLAIIGGAVHWSFGSVSTQVLLQLLAGGVPGVVIGCLLTRRVPSQKLKAVVAVIAICAGLQLVWSGMRTLVTQRAANTATSIGKTRGSQPVVVFSPVGSGPCCRKYFENELKTIVQIGTTMSLKQSCPPVIFLSSSLARFCC